MLQRLAIVGMALIAMILVAGCGGGSSSSGSTSGMVQLKVADAPLHLDGSVVSEVNVTITKVELLTGDEETSRAVLFTGSQQVNLLDQANKTLDQLLQLAMISVPAGTYEQLRLTVDPTACYVLLDGQTRQNITVSSGSFKIPVDFSISAGTTQVLLMDFDLSKLHQNKKFHLTPNAVRAVQMSEAGSVTGTAKLATGKVLTDPMPVTVTLQQAGAALPLATTMVELNPTTSEATFVINGIPVGDYTVTVSAPDGAEIFTQDYPVTITAGDPNNLGDVIIGTSPEPVTDPVTDPGTGTGTN